MDKMNNIKIEKVRIASTEMSVFEQFGVNEVYKVYCPVKVRGYKKFECFYTLDKFSADNYLGWKKVFSENTVATRVNGMASTLKSYTVDVINDCVLVRALV